MKLTATDRKTLIRLASSMGKGSPERKAVLAGLSKSVVANAAGKADKNAARGERNPALQKDLTKKLKRDLHVLDQGWTRKGGGDISPDQWKLIFGRYRLKSLKVGDSFTYDKRWDLYETDAEAVIKPANAEAAAGLNAYAEDGTSTLVERGGLLYLKFRAALDANPNWIPEGQGVHYAELKRGATQKFAAKKDMGGTDVRHPLYEAGDKITALEELAGETPLAGDAKYKSLAKKLSRAHDDLRKHLDANYNWD